MAFKGYQVWQRHDSVLGAAAATEVVVIVPTLMAHWSGQQWSDRAGARIAPIVLALAALVFAVGVARHLDCVGSPHPWRGRRVHLRRRRRSGPGPRSGSPATGCRWPRKPNRPVDDRAVANGGLE